MSLMPLLWKTMRKRLSSTGSSCASPFRLRLHRSAVADGSDRSRGARFCAVMSLIGLPPELGLAWLTAMLIGIWGAVPLIFTLVPVSSLTSADITVFSALILFAHGLPIEQKIIEKAGPGVLITTTLRVGGG